MKRIVLITAAILMMTFSASAQSSLGSILGKIGQKAKDINAGDIVTSITDLISGKSELSPATIAGTWNYTGSAISFKSDDNVLRFGDLKIDLTLHRACYIDTDLQLTNREYDVLNYFCNHPNRVITFEELGKALFGVYDELDRRTIMVNVSRLRKKMNVDPLVYNMVETVWSQGYTFIVKNT